MPTASMPALYRWPQIPAAIRDEDDAIGQLVFCDAVRFCAQFYHFGSYLKHPLRSLYLMTPSAPMYGFT